MLEGNVVVVVRELYGLKGDGPAWASELRQLMRDTVSTPCRAERYVWTRKFVYTSNIGAMTNDGLSEGEF